MFEGGYDCDLAVASGLESGIGLQVLNATARSWFLPPFSSASDGCRRDVMFDVCDFSDLTLDGVRDKLGPDKDNSGILEPPDGLSESGDN
jgi:hypothetical protein